MDGGTQLNTPVRPALDLGARRLVVVATEAVAGARAPDTDCDPPDVGDGALHLLQGHPRRSAGEGHLDARAAERSRGGCEGNPDVPYRHVPYMFVSPARCGRIGELANQVFRVRYGGLRGLRSPDMRLLNRLLGGDSPTHGELLSYLLVDREFVDALIEMGISDATALLKAPPGSDWPWRLGPLEAIASVRATVTGGSRIRAAAQCFVGAALRGTQRIRAAVDHGWLSAGSESRLNCGAPISVS